MMTDESLRLIWKDVTGESPSKDQIDKINRIMKDAGIHESDAMIIVITILQAEFSKKVDISSIQDQIVKSLSSDISEKIIRQVDEQRRVSSISQQIKLIAFTSVVLAFSIFLTYSFASRYVNAYSGIEWMKACDSKGNMPLMLVGNEEDKKCVMIGKDGKPAKWNGASVIWSIDN